jgi:hypothetical protein
VRNWPTNSVNNAELDNEIAASRPAFNRHAVPGDGHGTSMVNTLAFRRHLDLSRDATRQLPTVTDTALS